MPRKSHLLQLVLTVGIGTLNFGRFVTKSLGTEPNISSVLPRLKHDRKSR